MKKSESLKIKVYISFLIIFLPFYAISQDTVCKFSPHWYLNINVGASYSHTDIAKYIDFPEWPDFNNISPGLEIGFGRQLLPAFGLSVSFYRGFLKGESLNGDYFESDLYDYKLNATINFNKLFNNSSNSMLNFYATVGIGQAQYKTKVIDERGTTLYGYYNSLGDLKGTGIEGRRIVMIFPISLGLDFKLSEKIQLYADFTLKITNSDLIDGKIKGNDNDNYNFTSIGIRYNFRKKKKVTPEEKIEEAIGDKLDEKPKLSTELIPILAAELSPLLVDELSPILVAELSSILVAKLKPILAINLKSESIIEENPKLKQAKEIVNDKPIYENQIPKELKPSIITKPTIEYFVQISASYKQPLILSDLSNKFNLNQSKIIYRGVHNHWHIYTVGSFATEDEANKERKNLIVNHGVVDAFVVCFENGKRVN